MKLKLTRTLAVVCALTMMMGTAVTAYGYNFYLVAGQSDKTGIVRKQTNGDAYVERSGPAGATTVLTVNMCNSAGAQKSDQGNIAGIGHINLSYSKYGVVAGDYVALKGTNRVDQNGGQSISASGAFTP